MPIAFQCPECSSRLKAPEGAGGHKIKCPKCETPVTVPTTSGEEDAAAKPARQPAARKKDTPAETGAGATGKTDQNLLFGVLALHAALIDSRQFAEVCAAWSTRKETPLADLFTEFGYLSDDGKGEVERLLRRHLKKHDGDARASLDALTDEEVRHTLLTVDDTRSRRSPDETPAQQTTGISTVGYISKARDRYTFARLHAKGGIGQVWLARDETLGRDVALKELQPQKAESSAVRQRFVEEAKITGQLEHPSIVPVYELAEVPDDEEPFYTMRFVRGRTLSKAIHSYHKKRAARQTGPLDLLALLNAFVAVCNAVAYAHSRGVIHRDLKGQNIVLGDYGEVIVLDWGLAKVLGEPGSDADLPPVEVIKNERRGDTLQGQVLGTPAYMSPEQAEGRLDRIDQRSDVYGLGAILYELLTGQPPFAGDDTQDVLRKVREEEPPRPRQLVPVPPPLQAICLRTMSKRRRDRYQGATELAQDVQRWLADEPVLAYAESLPRRAGRWRRRHPAIVAAAVVLCFVGCAAAVWFKHDRDTRATEAAQRELENAQREAQTAQQTARAEEAARAALQEAALFQKQSNWPEAKTRIARAEGLLSASQSAEIRQAVQQARTDLETISRLDDVLLLETFTKGKFENLEADRAYHEAFRTHGFALESPDPNDVANRIKASSIRDQLLAALDDWIFVKPRADATGRDRLLAIVKQVDSDPWRQQLRDQIPSIDIAALEGLAKRPEVASQPPTTLVHLGKYLAQGGSFTLAAELLRQAQRRYSEDFWPNYALGMCLITMQPPQAEEAIGCFRASLAVRPRSFIGHFSLARALLLQHRYPEALAHLKKVDELLDPNDPRRKAQTGLTHECERLQELAEQMPALLTRKVKPRELNEMLTLATMCQFHKRYYGASAQFYEDAFKAQPRLAENVPNNLRYNAACAAAMVGCGQGEDASQFTLEQCAAMRRLALDWLRADLAFWTKVSAAKNPEASKVLATTLSHWQKDSDLAGLRDTPALTKLSTDEQSACRKLWEEVAGLLKQS